MLWIIFLLSVVTAFLVTQLSIVLSHRRGVLDVPNVRSSHSQPIPRLGGVGILVAVVISIAALAAIKSLTLIGYSILTRDVLVLLAAGIGMAATGLYDDFHGLRPAYKFLMQFLLAGLILIAGFRIERVSLLDWGPFSLGVLAIPVTILWLTGFANIFNFMDGINGISGVTAAAYFAFFAMLAWRQGSIGLAAVAVVFVGSCLGFVPHNFPVARTFMGDTGSLMLGISLAFYVVRLSQLAANPATLVALILICSVYLWDSGFTLLRRLRRGENIFQAHRSHLYQRLVQLGGSHARITLLYLILHMLMGCLALAFVGSGNTLRAGILGLATLTLAVFTATVYRFERRAGKLAPGARTTGTRN